jgi:hypothetical protein
MLSSISRTRKRYPVKPISMKTIRQLVCGSVFLLGVICADAQPLPINEPDYFKPQVFAHLPKVMDLNIPDLETLFSIPVGGTVNRNISPLLPIKGTVVSKSDPFNNKVQSVVVRSAVQRSVVFTFSKVQEEDGSFRYLGRIMSLENSDAYEIEFENNKYVLKRKHLYDIINE